MRYRVTRSQRRTLSGTVEVSLTPLIDTALTLLIIFMVTTPMMQQAIKVTLPQGKSNEGKHDTHDFVVTIDKQGIIFFNKNVVALEEVGNVVKKTIQESQKIDQTVWVHSDGAIACDVLIRVIDSIKVAGGVKDVNVAIQKKSIASA